MDTIQEIINSEKSDLKDVFEFFMRDTIKLPKSSKTPLGKFLAKSKEENLENYSKQELVNLLDTHIRDFIILELENEIFEHFLLKNCPSFNPDEFKDDELLLKLQPSKPIKFSSNELAHRKDRKNASGKNLLNLEASDVNLQFYIKAIEQEIKDMHNAYQKDTEKHEKKLNQVLAEQKAHELHLEKINKTRETFEMFIVKTKDNKTVVNPSNFADFLRLAIKQDKEDIRRMKVMLYELEGHCKLLKQLYKEKPRHKVDLEIKGIESEQIKAQINEKANEFLQVKNLLDQYNKKIEQCSKELNERKQMLAGLQNELDSLKKNISSYKHRKSMLESSLEQDMIKAEKLPAEGFNEQDFWAIGQEVPDLFFYTAGKLSCSRTQRQINMYKRKLAVQENLIAMYKDKLNLNDDNSESLE
ncbi:uncharacterized protein LOC106667124 isoform X2 [Cimex lectularius]|uniref:Uncharacterized protein n=1 Tax=Cimex lectularius TaxID=79782 RepID=A0A8I6RSQ1_CIMLE|nr:uncharacterized protein LOC106667124 isoform X2 [Cimex lectularius]